MKPEKVILEIERLAQSGRVWLCLLALGLFAAAGSRPALAADAPSCLTCHADKAGYAEDVHARKSLSCTACHGGDDKATDMDAMSPAKGFRGKIARTKIPELCGSCHADGTYMKNYAPRLRVDQLALYKTSVHGKKLAAGDTHVATCIDCHGVHGIRPVADPRSQVFPIHQPETCGRCHTGKQRTEYEQSVHWELLSKNREMGAPACATCHGSHGATPPKVASVANVCGTCHVLVEDLFQKSVHGTVFKAAGMRGCEECHSNHRVLKTSDAMLGDRPPAVCAQCHSAGDAGTKLAVTMAGQLADLRTKYQTAENTVQQAEVYGMEVSDARIELASASQALVQARVQVHALDLRSFDEQVDKGRKSTAVALNQGTEALRDREFRRKGLLISIAAILITIIGLALMIRSIEGKSKRRTTTSDA